MYNMKHDFFYKIKIKRTKAEKKKQFVYINHVN